VNRARPSLQKREREKAKREKQAAKAVRRAEAKERKASGSGMDDSDLAAIIPGPQPKPWDDETEP
jgi:hypothetical protein